MQNDPIFVVFIFKPQTMKRKFTLLLSALLLLSSGIFAQKNVVKIKPLRPVFSIAAGQPVTLPLAYERVIIPRLSAQLNFSYQLNGDLGLPGPVDLGDLGVDAPTISSWGIGPEIRFYPNIAKETPRGFYLSGYLNFNRSSISSSYDYNQDLDFNGVTVNYESTLDLTGYFNRLNYGLAIGSQWLVADRVAIDVLWLGLGWGSANIGADIEGPLVDVNQINSKLAAQGAPPIAPTNTGIPTWSDVTDQFDSDLADVDIPILNPTLSASSTANSANININANLPNLRLFNFSVGFAF